MRNFSEFTRPYPHNSARHPEIHSVFFRRDGSEIRHKCWDGPIERWSVPKNVGTLGVRQNLFWNDHEGYAIELATFSSDLSANSGEIDPSPTNVNEGFVLEKKVNSANALGRNVDCRSADGWQIEQRYREGLLAVLSAPGGAVEITGPISSVLNFAQASSCCRLYEVHRFITSRYGGPICL